MVICRGHTASAGRGRGASPRVRGSCLSFPHTFLTQQSPHHLISEVLSESSCPAAADGQVPEISQVLALHQCFCSLTADLVAGDIEPLESSSCWPFSQCFHSCRREVVVG